MENYKERLEELGYDKRVINIILGTIKIAKETITNNRDPKITPEVQKLVIDEVKKKNKENDN